jgi:hypothetical protein
MINVTTALLIGIVLGGLASVVYFSYTGTELKWKR